jgi:F-type H+-transporting ATPase subunit b
MHLAAAELLAKAVKVASGTPATTNPLIPSATELIMGLIGFVVVFVVLGRMLLPRIQKTLEERTNAIEGGLQRAEEAQKQANEQLDQYREQLQEARHESARLREEAREEGARIKAEILAQAQAEAARLVTSAQAQIDSERQQALATLRRQVGDLATDLAGRIVGESLTDEARQSRVVDRFLDELEGQGDQAAELRAGR